MSDSDRPRVSQISIPSTLQRVLARTVVGPLGAQNRDVIDWGWNGFLAYGAQTTVAIVDPTTLQCIQTLTKHRTYVIQVKWQKTYHYHQVSAPYSLILASSDNSGLIHVWNVIQGEVSCTLQDGNRPVSEIEWLGREDATEHLLLALHPPYSIILWDTRQGSKVWKKSYTEILQTFRLDPFNLNRMAFLCHSCLLIVNDFGVQKSPSSNGQRFFLSSPTSPSRPTEDKSIPLRRKLREKVEGKLRNEESATSATMSDCLQMMYHQNVIDLLILLYSREVLVMDMRIEQTVSVITLDKGASPFLQIVSSNQRDMFYCLHDSGSVSAYLKRPLLLSANLESEDKLKDIPHEGFSSIYYDRHCHSDALRLSKSSRAMGICVNPVTEKSIALILGDGRMVFKNLMHTSILNASQEYVSYKSDESFPFIKDNHFSKPFTQNSLGGLPPLSLSLMVPTVRERESMVDLNLRLLVTGLMPSLCPPPLVLRMCPPLTTRNLREYRPLLAAGTSQGTVQIINVATGEVEREFAVHTYPIKGIEWTSLHSFLSYGIQPLSNASGKVRNEIFHTDARTGCSIPLRTNKSEESPIQMIRVSYLKQYFIVILKEEPFELWECHTLSLLRTMPRKFPRVTALEWSPTSHMKSRKSSNSSSSGDGKKDPEIETTGLTESASFGVSDSMYSLKDAADKPIVKEMLVFTDTAGVLYRFSVEGNVIKDVSMTPADSQMGSITSIAWKGHDIVLSDNEGCLSTWDLRARIAKHMHTHRGLVHKMRFAPGKDNLKLLLLFNDGVDIWDIRDLVLVAQLRSPKDVAKVLDIEWAASDRPILSLADGCVRITDMTLRLAGSRIGQYCLREPVVSPYLLTCEFALNLKTVMIHRSWTEEGPEFTDEDGFTNSSIHDIKLWISRLDPDVMSFFVNCNVIVYRAVLTAYLFGDYNEIYFWSVAIFYLHFIRRAKASREKQLPLLGSSGEGRTSQITDSVRGQCSVDSETVWQSEEEEKTCVHPLDTSFDHLCDNKVYKYHEIERLLIHEGQLLSGKLREDLGRHLAVIGQRDRVVRLLLEGDAAQGQSYSDALRACLLADTNHSAQAQSTIKLVATNLIANGAIWEGIELLCLTGKAVDAVRYLQSHGSWKDSTWLAKCVLSRDESKDPLKRWATHLLDSGRKTTGICTLISIEEVDTALEQLLAQHLHQRAALLLDASIELDVMPPFCDRALNNTLTESQLYLSSLQENIYRKYVLFLFGIGNRVAARDYCRKMGSSGRPMLREMDLTDVP